MRISTNAAVVAILLKKQRQSAKSNLKFLVSDLNLKFEIAQQDKRQTLRAVVLRQPLKHFANSLGR